MFRKFGPYKTLRIRVRKHSRNVAVAKSGRPAGAKSKVPGAVRASVKAVIEEVVSERQPTIRAALIDGVTAGPRHADRYLRLMAEYTDGKPDANMNIRTSFKEDEIESASRSLERKMLAMFERAKKTIAVLGAADESDSENPQ